MTKKFYLNFLNEAFQIQNCHSWTYSDDFNFYVYEKERITIKITPGIISDTVLIYDSNELVYKKAIYYFISDNNKSVSYIKHTVHVDYITSIFKNNYNIKPDLE